MAGSLNFASAGFLLLTLLRSRLMLLGIPLLLFVFDLSAAMAYPDASDLLIHENGELVTLPADGRAYTTKRGRRALFMVSGKGCCRNSLCCQSF